MIPVFQVRVPEYTLRRFTKSSKTSSFKLTPWYNIKIPKVYEDNKPDFEAIGKKIDLCLKKHFLGKKVAVRVLGSEEHRGKSMNDIIKIIKKLGHDRYNPNKKGDRYANIDNKHIDFFALDFTVRKYCKYFRQFVEPFYYWPIHDRGRPIRIDIAIVYDRTKLQKVHHRYKGREAQVKRDGFVFKEIDKPKAILGIIKIL